MKEKMIKSLISEYIAEADSDMDLNESVMSRIKLAPSFSVEATYTRKLLLMIAALLMLTLAACTAASQLIKLKADNGNTDLAIEIVNEEALDITKPNVFADFSYDDVPVNLRDIPHIIIYVEDPSHKSVSRATSQIVSYDEVVESTEMESYLPEVIGNFTFSKAQVAYETILPSEEELKAIAAEHPDEEFYTFELESNGRKLDWYEYEFKELYNASYMVQVTYKPDQELTLHNEHVTDYEVVSLDGTEGFLFHRERMEASHAEGEESKYDEVKNNYQLYWKNGDYEYSIRPAFTSRMYFDPDNRNEYSYPEYTKENIVLLATEINGFLNGK